MVADRTCGRRRAPRRRQPLASTLNRQSRAGFTKPRVPCCARPLAFGHPVQTVPASRGQFTPDKHGSGSRATGATQPRGEPALPQLGHPPSRRVHTGSASCSLPPRWEPRRATDAPALTAEALPALDILLPTALLASFTDRQTARSRALQTHLTESPCPGCFTVFPKTRTVTQPDAPSAESSLVEVTKGPSAPALAADPRRGPRWRWPVDQCSTVPDGLVAIHR